MVNSSVADAATYSVIVSNSAGVMQSSNAMLTVFVKPTIQNQPTDATVFVGVNATFSVTATGDSPLTFQWQKGSVDIANATNSIYTVANAKLVDAGFYRCIIRNPAPDFATSAAAQLTVLPDLIAPVVTTTWPAANVQVVNGQKYTNRTFVTTAPDVPLSGAVSDNGVITNVTLTRIVPPWAVAPIAVSPVGTDGAKTWTNITQLVDGTNIYQLTASDSSGLTTTLLRTIFLRTTNRLTVLTNGYGSTVASGSLLNGSARNGAWLDIGRNYSIKAVPKTGNWFVNWTDGSGAVIGTNVTLTFRMTNNLSLTANFVTNGIIAGHLAGGYNGLFAEDSGVQIDSAGAVMSLAVTTTRTFSGKVVLAGATNSFSGVFDALGKATRPVVRHLKPTLTIALQLDLANGTKQITGSVSSALEGWSSPLLANLSVYSAVNKNPTAARYTMAIPPLPSSDTNAPVGYGYGLITNRPTGLVTMTGALADLTAISYSAPISKDSDWPVCVNLYSRQGLLHGWVNFSSGAPVGHLAWIKPSVAQVPALVNKLYPAGVSDSVDVFGSIYHLASPTISLPVGSLEVDVPTFNPATYPIAVTNNNMIVSPLHIAGTVTASTGLITLTLPSTISGGITRNAYGVVLQSLNAAVGTVRGINAAVSLH